MVNRTTLDCAPTVPVSLVEGGGYSHHPDVWPIKAGIRRRTRAQTSLIQFLFHSIG
jgi:hypothetical protein